MARLRDLDRLSLRWAGLFSLFSLGYLTTGEPAYLGFLGFAALPLLSGPHLSKKVVA